MATKVWGVDVVQVKSKLSETQPRRLHSEMT